VTKNNKMQITTTTPAPIAINRAVLDRFGSEGDGSAEIEPGVCPIVGTDGAAVIFVYSLGPEANVGGKGARAC
jgi:hypothetical protein